MLPLGNFESKGSGEAMNKVNRRNRREHARKTSREENLTDVLHSHLESSDPLVVSNMRFAKKKSTPISPAMKDLLLIDPPAAKDLGPREESDGESSSEPDSDSDWEMD